MGDTLAERLAEAAGYAFRVERNKRGDVSVSLTVRQQGVETVVSGKGQTVKRLSSYLFIEMANINPLLLEIDYGAAEIVGDPLHEIREKYESLLRENA